MKVQNKKKTIENKLKFSHGVLCAAFLLTVAGGFSFCLNAAEAASFADGLRGRILLDVENHGEAWYVTPMPAERHYLGRPTDAFALMRTLGLGITNADLSRIPEFGSSATGDLKLRARLSGRILLQVESRGEAWYVDPETAHRHLLGSPADAFATMQQQGMGISEADLALVPVAASAPKSVQHDVPFAAQAPFGGWDDRRQQEGCEEASVLMAVHWAKDQPIDATEALRDILAASDWQLATYGSYEDTSVADTVERLVKGYFDYAQVETRVDVDVDDIYRALVDGGVALVPVNGRLLGNPNFTPPGPLRHMIVVTGYDVGTDAFIVNEPGTRAGARITYSRQVLANALMDYPTGYHEPIMPGATALAVVRKAR